jgi:hypothetical protein
LAPGDQAIFSMLIHGLGAAEISSQLGIAPTELEARRQLILQTIAPKAARSAVMAGAQSTLDYDRPLRRHRYSRPG